MKSKAKILSVMAGVLVLLLFTAACKKQTVINDEQGAGSLDVMESGEGNGDATTAPGDTSPGDDSDILSGNSGQGQSGSAQGTGGQGTDSQGGSQQGAGSQGQSGGASSDDNAGSQGQSGDKDSDAEKDEDKGSDDEGLTWGSGAVIKVISQNVLVDGPYNNATKKVISTNNDGTPISGPNRRPVMKEVLSKYDADSIGFQEVSWGWKEWLAEDFSAYTQRGIMRYGDNYKGSASNELDLLMYKTDKFKELKWETVWLSDTPYIEASKTWGGTNPCTFTYALLEIKETGENIAHFTTHYSHDSAEAQTKAGAQMAEFIINFLERNQQNGHTIPVYATGDYNVSPDSEGYNSMCTALTDPITIAKERVGENTFPTWNHDAGQYGIEPTGRIDFCFVNANAMVVDKYEVIRGTVNGIPPSDHYGLYIESRINTLI